MKLLFIEGLPGSGKTTLAEGICQVAKDSGARAVWFREESKHHPLFPASLRKEKRSSQFAQLCLAHWDIFLQQNTAEDQLFIFEGSLWQTAVRHLLEANLQSEISGYLSATEQLLAELDCRLIYLRPDSLRQHIDWVVDFRGPLWSGKVAEYLGKTPWALRRGFDSAQVMLPFWLAYGQLCDELTMQTPWPLTVYQSGLGQFGDAEIAWQNLAL